MAIAPRTPLEPMVGDPDDHRPQSEWRLAVDPAGAAHFAFLEERCAPGDRIPLHRHDVDEVVIVLNGRGAYTLDGEEAPVSAGDVVFVPAGAAHGTVNSGDEPLHLHAVFPTTRVRMEMLERNPAPGTEHDRPQTVVYDFATGSFEVIT